MGGSGGKAGLQGVGHRVPSWRTPPGVRMRVVGRGRRFACLEACATVGQMPPQGLAAIAGG